MSMIDQTEIDRANAMTTELKAQVDSRIERDSLGELRVPMTAYYGVQTMRAKENFPISDLRFPRRFIRALGQIKAAAAEVNVALGLLDAELGIGVTESAPDYTFRVSLPIQFDLPSLAASSARR